MKKFFLFLISAFTAAHAFANPFSNFYMDIFGGLNIVNNYKTENSKIYLNEGYAIGGNLGYRFSKFFRLEGEVAYRNNRFDLLVIESYRFPLSGKIQKVTAMANGILEFPFIHKELIPYIGVGIGNNWNRESLQIEPIVTNEGIWLFDSLESKSYGLAYQGIAGFIFFTGLHFQTAIEFRYLNGYCTRANYTVDVSLRGYF